ncbi:MAG TPA: hypothetical protein PLJ27_24075 [Polyangiaceae bacterium]|nr:MAG: hypothetical protein BWY17_02480 [Deltaproteobacteria bacterium ADurb.Bin207]HNS98801.1 hypothetical protein [Polyangiaceae bacterium]HNZ23336.1 hypothetical protein [Polyangiaceae bacterium]HOD21894.1 hypothetical protein [Polyangiaceae bacterium]HOE49339.1 hypothetical protein [Polyangiaceae bacterium]
MTVSSLSRVLMLCAFVSVSCSSSENGESSANGNHSDGGADSSDGTGGTGGAGGSAGTGGTGGGILNTDSGNDQGTEEACVQQSVEATIEHRPIDIIFVIDNSGSMSAEIEEVEAQINANFASIIDSAVPAIDYRVVMLSRYGAFSSRKICVAEPLGGAKDDNQDGHCDAPLPNEPINTSKFFHHSMSIGSYNAFCQLLAGFSAADEFKLQPNGYGEILRPEAFKFITVITDDRVNCPPFDDLNTENGGKAAAQAFDKALRELSPEHFGKSENERNYSFWSIVAMAPYEPTAAKPNGSPHPPDESLSPVTTEKCKPSAVNPGTGYQALSIMTGGYRFPTCGLDYTEMFQLMAEGVVKGSEVPCEFMIPEPPPGETLDLNTVEVAYKSNGTLVEVFNKVASEEECDSSSFLIDGERIVLCPQACDVVQADADAKIDILFGCEIQIK